MFRILFACLLVFLVTEKVCAQKVNIATLKTALEQAPDPVAYIKKSKRKWRVDTVVITSNKQFLRLSDSIGYHGKIKKVYGPAGDSILLQVLAKAPNIFYRASHIILDTPKLNINVAKKLSDTILNRIRRKAVTYEDMARIYNTDGSAPIGGDLGWRARGTLLPVLENAILKEKKRRDGKSMVAIWTSYSESYGNSGGGCGLCNNPHCFC